MALTTRHLSTGLCIRVILILEASLSGVCFIRKLSYLNVRLQKGSTIVSPTPPQPMRGDCLPSIDNISSLWVAMIQGCWFGVEKILNCPSRFGNVEDLFSGFRAPGWGMFTELLCPTDLES